MKDLLNCKKIILTIKIRLFVLLEQKEIYFTLKYVFFCVYKCLTSSSGCVILKFLNLISQYVQLSYVISKLFDRCLIYKFQIFPEISSVFLFKNTSQKLSR